MTVGFDTNVFVSAAASQMGSSRRCFVLLARRKFLLAVTKEILHEYERTAEELSRRPGRYHGMKWRPLFRWVHDKAAYFEPPPVGKQRSRDLADDIFLACALASGAKFIVSHDRDLLALEKPFGIEIMTPAVFVARVKTV
ncbi:MAG: putative toxin-antitoxin system toxin component, PIN family [Verrucomicrobia bacterium]|nr:putative toxin-antitoxin system toxin component, PIN family [Verrucomicrobiota bacterium]